MHACIFSKCRAVVAIAWRLIDSPPQGRVTAVISYFPKRTQRPVDVVMNTKDFSNFQTHLVEFGVHEAFAVRSFCRRPATKAEIRIYPPSTSPFLFQILYVNALNRRLECEESLQSMFSPRAKAGHIVHGARRSTPRREMGVPGFNCVDFVLVPEQEHVNAIHRDILSIPYRKQPFASHHKVAV